MGAGIATIALVKLYVEGHYTKERAHSEYPRLIKRLASEKQNYDRNFAQFMDLDFKSKVGAHEDFLKETRIWERYVIGSNVPKLLNN